MTFRGMLRNIGAKISQIPPIFKFAWRDLSSPSAAEILSSPPTAATPSSQSTSGNADSSILSGGSFLNVLNQEVAAKAKPKPQPKPVKTASGTKSESKPPKPPKAPKMDHGPKIRFPKTALQYYNIKYWAAVKRDSPEMPDSVVRHSLAARWSKLSPEARQPFQAEADADAARYADDIRDLSPEKRAELDAARSKLDLQIIEAEKLREQYQMPKHPQSPFVEYMSENYESKSNTETHKEYCARLADQWSKLPTDDKEARKKKYADEKAVYETKFSAWKDKLSAAGKEAEIQMMISKPRYQY